MTASELLRNIRTQLAPLYGDFAQPNAEAVVGTALSITRVQLYTDTSIIIGDDDLARVNAITQRHLKGEPLQYIFGMAYFYDREFFVDANVLIPRPDTETLVEAVINSEKDCPARFADIGTGSGIIAAVLAAHRPKWRAVAVDISYGALRVAKKNILSSGITNGRERMDRQDSSSPPKNIHLVCCDMLTAVRPEKQFDFIVSNPPYISSTQMKALGNSVAGYEPHTALRGGNDGLDYYRMISGCAKMYLKDGGRVYLEIGYDQGESVPGIFSDDGWAGIAVTKDLAGNNRVVTASSSQKLADFS